MGRLSLKYKCFRWSLVFNDAMERATASRKKVLDSNQEVVSVITQVGTVDLIHSN